MEDFPYGFCSLKGTDDKLFAIVNSVLMAKAHAYVGTSFALYIEWTCTVGGT
jgi:hypothetical protein